MKHALSLVAAFLLCGQVHAATRECMTAPEATARSYSLAVTTTGMERTIWLAGLTTITRSDGTYIGNDFNAQTDEIFKIMAARLKSLGADMKDVVKMTVYVSDGRYHARFAEIRKRFFTDCLPASDFVVVGFPQPDMVVEISAIVQTAK
jgi:enamine deaminase RidA (YjgF/YER057c/UK114 family)